MADVVAVVCIRPGCQEPIQHHRNEQGHGNPHEENQFAHRKDGRSRREIVNGQYSNQMDYPRLPLLSSR